MNMRSLLRLGRALLLCALATPVLVTPAPATERVVFQPRVTPKETGCTPDQRREALRAEQTQVLASVPDRLTSLEKALQPGGHLAGWRLSHGYVVLSTAGSVALDNVNAPHPVPQVLLYAPSPASKPRDLLDFEGPDNPYHLAGWAYIAPYTPGSKPPSRRCVAPSEWFVHEAGWHLKDGGMQLTPGAQTEPRRPRDLDIHMWHPQIWDIHVWRGDAGVPTVSFVNPNASSDGLPLPDLAFYYIVNGEKRPPLTTSR